MENKLSKELSKRWIMSYLAMLFIGILCIIAAAAIGYVICSRKIWYASDKWYTLISNIHDNLGICILAAFLVLNIILVIKMFGNISKAIQQISDSITHIDENSDFEIELPSMFGVLQHQLDELNLNLKMSRQAEREANNRKNDMLMYMAHDLKTPLTSIIGYLNLINDEEAITDETRKKYEAIILKKALRLEDLINEFFDITRMNFTRMILETSQVNMSVMVEQMLFEFQPVFNSKGLTYTYEKDENVQVMCDVNKMERVFDNLLKNIANYSYSNTNIKVELRRYEDNGFTLKTSNCGKTIPQEKQEAIFQQFFRMDSSRSTSSGGAGLGLAVSKQIVDLHGGQIRCESEDEVINFIVTVPGRSKA